MFPNKSAAWGLRWAGDMQMHLLVMTAVVLSATGCGDDAPRTDAGTDALPVDVASEAGRDAAVPDECTLGEVIDCATETRQRFCAEEDGLMIQERECEAACLFGTCASAGQLETVEQLRTYIGQVRATSGHPFEADWDALEEEMLQEFLRHEGEEALVRAATRFVRSFRHGHQALTFGDEGERCGGVDGLPYSAQTYYAGVCGKAVGDEVLVMSAPDDNALGLSPGDTIVSTSEWAAGPRFFDDIRQAPGCTTRVGPSEAGDRAEAAAVFFGKIDSGMTLEVRAPDGAMRMVTVTPREDVARGQDFCLDPFGGYSSGRGTLSVREDGVAVIRLPSLHTGRFGSAAEYFMLIDEFLEHVGGLIDEIPEGAPIVWDVRGNSGGSVEIALGIVAGMPGARDGLVAESFFRIEDSDPPAWESEAAQSFSIATAEDHVTNHRDHPTAVLIDAQTVSAADHFARAASLHADVLLVGAEGTAGAYGYGGQPFVNVLGPLATLRHRVDPLRVVAGDGTLLERVSVMPDLVVEYSATDVAAGVDTVLEAAAAALLSE